MIKLSLPDSVIGEMYVHDHEDGSAHIASNHEMFIVNFLTKYLKSNSNFVDLGAYQGYFSLIASKMIDAGTIYSFEPCVGSYKILQKNIELHDLTNVKTYNMAMSDRTGNTILQWRRGAECVGRIFDIPADSNECHLDTIQCTCLDDFFKDEIIDCIKIDIEGAEVELFEGAKEFFNRNKQCKVILELHSMNIRHRNTNYNEFVSSLLDMFNFYNFNMDKYSKDEINKLYLPSYSGGHLVLVSK